MLGDYPRSNIRELFSIIPFSLGENIAFVKARKKIDETPNCNMILCKMLIIHQAHRPATLSQKGKILLNFYMN